MYRENISPAEVEWWCDEKDVELGCKCVTPVIKDVIMTTDYGSCRVWKGQMCEGCLFIVKGHDAFEEDDV